MRALILSLVFLLSGLLSPGPAMAAADPFADPAPTRQEAATPSTPPPQLQGQSMLGSFEHWLVQQQRALNKLVSGEIRAVRDTGSPTALFALLGLSFLYGVLHAVGPGHGKAVIASYFVTHEARWHSGIVMGGLISLLQGISAIVMVFLLSLALQVAGTRIQEHAALVETVSYGLIVAIGATMFWRAITGQGCGHHHGPIGSHNHGPACGHADHGPHDHHHHHHHHGHHDHGHEHAHHHGHGHTHLHHDHGQACNHHGHAAVPTPPKGRARFDNILLAAAGVAPCASAIIIMLFALGTDAMGIGVMAVMALSLGMGITVSMIGILSIVSRNFLARVSSQSTGRFEQIERGLGVLGSIAIMAFSGLLMLDAYSRIFSPI